MARKTQRRYRIPPGYSTTQAIIDILLDFGKNFTLLDSPYQRMRRSWRKIQGAPEPTRWRFNRAIRYLEGRGLVQKKEQNSQIFIRLTKEGKVNALLLRLEKEFKKSPQWDGRWRVIIWDIPEDAREQRDRIRWFIKNLGFFQIQKSVFVTPYPLPPAAVAYLKESGLLQYIRFLRVDKMDDDQILRKHFGLT